MKTVIADSGTLHEKSLYSELFWSVFSRIRTEYGEILFYAHFYGHFLRSGNAN